MARQILYELASGCALEGLFCAPAGWVDQSHDPI
jgi:hypothetical protein